MSAERSRGILGRLLSLIRGVFAGWIRDGEEQNPRAVYESAILEKTRQYHELKQAVAGMLRPFILQFLDIKHSPRIINSVQVKQRNHFIHCHNFLI
jgi:hypothetical protein